MQLPCIVIGLLSLLDCSNCSLCQEICTSESQEGAALPCFFFFFSSSDIVYSSVEGGRITVKMTNHITAERGSFESKIRFIIRGKTIIPLTCLLSLPSHCLYNYMLHLPPSLFLSFPLSLSLQIHLGHFR